MSTNPLLTELRRLRTDVANPQARGLGFEVLVERAFRGAHFRVERNPGMARPRQTDLVAVGGGSIFLIEAKWRRSRATIDDVHSLVTRMSLAPPGVVGVLISMSGFTRPAVKTVGGRRDHPVLLIDGTEVEAVCAGSTSLRLLLDAKRDALLWDGLVSLGAPIEKRRKPAAFIAPAGAHILQSDGLQVPWVACAGGYERFTFARDITDPDWVPATGVGVTLHLPLRLADLDEVAWALGELSALGWATDAGHWCVAQAETNWHGIGPSTLIAALQSHRERYRGAGQIHHAEHTIYQDTFDNGFLTMELEVDAHDRRRVRHAALSLQLGGVPVDTEPVRELCRTFGITRDLSFRPRSGATLERQHLDHDTKPDDVVGFCVEPDASDDLSSLWVAGVILRNPYFRNATIRDEGSPWDSDLAGTLTHTELLICDLGSWHPLGDTPTYRLRFCEWASTPTGQALHVMADW